jgi:uncharacterized protein YjiS (DUF1127 family)
MFLELSAKGTSVPHRKSPVITGLRCWLQRQLVKVHIARERRELAALPPHLLRDIGVDPIDAKREGRRSFSDIPQCRLHCDKRND